MGWLELSEPLPELLLELLLPPLPLPLPELPPPELPLPPPEPLPELLLPELPPPPLLEPPPEGFCYCFSTNMKMMVISAYWLGGTVAVHVPLAEPVGVPPPPPVQDAVPAVCAQSTYCQYPLSVDLRLQLALQETVSCLVSPRLSCTHCCPPLASHEARHES